MLLKIRKKSIAEWLVLFVLVMPFAFFFFIDLMGLGGIIKYTIDIAWLLLLVIIVRSRSRAADSETPKLAWIASVFFLLTVVGLILHFQSPLYYLWGLRNNVRFFVFFFSCIIFLDRRYIADYMKIFDVIFWINVPIVFYQYFVLGFSQDYLGGIFGTEKGCNAYTTIFFSIIIAKSLLMFLNYREKKSLCILKCVIVLLISAITELKFFFVLFAVIVVIAFAMTRLTLRKVGIAVLSVVGVYIAISVLVAVFPEYADWFSLENMLETVTTDKGYTLSGDMNRLTTFSIALEKFLTTLPDKLFGLGLGNCDYSSSFDFLTSPFYRNFGHLNYTWFSSAYLILETGIIGTVVYFSFFVVLFFSISKKQKSMTGDDAIYCRFAKIMAVVAVMMLVYNASMRMEAGYMIYFTLALPFIGDGADKKQNKVV